MPRYKALRTPSCRLGIIRRLTLPHHRLVKLTRPRRLRRRANSDYTPIPIQFPSPVVQPQHDSDLQGIPTTITHDDQFAIALVNVPLTIGNRTIYEVNYSIPNCYSFTEFHLAADFNDTFWSTNPVHPAQGQPRFQIYHFNRHTQFFLRHLSAELSILYARRSDGTQLVKRHHYCYPANWIHHHSRILSLSLGI